MDKYINGLKLQQVLNKIGKYIYKHIDGAYKIQFSSNQCDVWFNVYYQPKYYDRIPGKGEQYNDVKTMSINLNLATYQDKIRVNVIDGSGYGKTLGHFVLKDTDLSSFQAARDVIYDTTIRIIVKNYKDTDFIF